MSNPIFHFFRRISGHENKTLGGGPSAALQGTICALVAAICYGLLPTLVLPMSESNAAANPEDFMPNLSILFYRFISAAVIIGLFMLIKRKSFASRAANSLRYSTLHSCRMGLHFSSLVVISICRPVWLRRFTLCIRRSPRS